MVIHKIIIHSNSKLVSAILLDSAEFDHDHDFVVFLMIFNDAQDNGGGSQGVSNLSKAYTQAKKIVQFLK